MDNETSPFGTFETGDPQPKPETPAVSPKRRSRRSRSEPSATTKNSSAKPTPPVRRKYTRRTTIAVPSAKQLTTAAAATSTMKVVGELDIVMQIVDTLSHYDAKSKARILAAVARFS
jgi:hypothetical protein